MNKSTRSILLFVLCLLPLFGRADQFDTLRIYWQNYLITNGGSASSVASTANGYWGSMNTNASRTYLWSDLPFGSVSANIVSTYQRLQAMSLAWAMPASSLHNNANLATTIASGLDWMNANVYTTSATEYNNWFHWEISGPQALNNTEVLLYPALSGTQITNYCNAMDRFSPGGAGATYDWMTGANTSDKVLVVAIRGILGKDAGKLTAAQTNLSPVFLYVTGGDGFYRDGSFVFHSNIAYNGHYGLVLLGDIPNIVNLLQGSAWQITDPNLTNVFNWVSASFQPLIYHGALMDMVRGRAVSWSYETESEDGSGAISAARRIAQFAPTNFAVPISNWASSPQVAPGQYHFAAMDRVVAARSNFTFGISMSSTRIANYESINSGNLHGWHQGDGMTYLYLGNSENQFNSDFWPTVDPYHLPGTTAETNSLSNSAGQATTTDQNWVGGAQVARTYGVAGMSLHLRSTTVTGKKSWFMLDNEIVCLGAGITCGDASGVDTTAENRRLGNPMTQTFTLNGTVITPAVGWSSNLPAATPSWCALSGTGGYYFPAGNSNLQASFTANTGAWSQVNSGDDSTSHTDDYFRLCYNHGIRPTNATYAYVILPNSTATTVSNYANAPDIVILSNTPQLQALKKGSLGVVAANFWTNGIQTADLVSVNSRASVITLETSNSLAVGISDPTQTNNGVITVTLNRAATGLLSADAGITVQQLSPQIIFTANVAGRKGAALQASFGYANSILPSLSGVSPSGATLLQSTNTFSFTANSAVGINSNDVSVLVNGVQAPNLIFSGSSNSWNVSYPALLPNMVYTIVATATDGNGNVATTTKTFDTFSAANYIWEAEDFDYNGGNYFDNPQTNAYAGLKDATNVDSHQVNFAGVFLYRPNGMDTEINGDVARAKYSGAGYPDYSIGYFSANAWANYTRHFPAGSYNVYARLAAGGGATTCTLGRVTGGWGTTNQFTNLLGTFYVSNTGWESYSYIPLRDNASNLVTVAFSGATDTLRLARPGTATSDCNANFLMLVPVFAVNATFDGTNFNLSFPTQSGFNYQVQYKSNVADTVWNPLTDIAGNDLMEVFSEPSTNDARFYRVMIH